MAWPGTASGGASSDAWGDSVRLFIQAAIAAGSNWHIGAHAADHLDAGNVMGHVVETGAALWVDLACDAISCKISDGATAQAGIMARDEAATLDLELFDPTRKYDPTNSTSPYWLGNRSRLQPGTPVQVFAEVLNAAGTGVVTYLLFSGTTDRWTAPIQRDPADRRARVTASGSVKHIAAQNYAELTTPVGLNDTTAARLARIKAYYNLAGTLEQVGASTTIALQSTTLAQSAWEHLNRTIDDELGFLHVLPNGTIRWWTRGFWTTTPAAPAVTLGCADDVPAALDVVEEAALSAVEDQLRNAVYASRTGGVQQVVRSQASISAHGGYEASLNRTDLGLSSDPQVLLWAQLIVTLFGYPQPAPIALTMQPAIAGELAGAQWRSILGLQYVSDTARLIWQPDDGSGRLDFLLRVLGAEHTITPDAWQIAWQLIPAQLATGNVWHIGPHAADKLDRGNLMGWTHSTGTLELEEAADAA